MGDTTSPLSAGDPGAPSGAPSKLTVPKAEFIAAVQAAGNAGRGTHQTAGFVLRFDGRRLFVRGTNQNETITAVCPNVTGAGEFEVAVPVPLADTLSVMPGEDIGLELSDKELTVSSGAAEVALMLGDVARYPKPRAVPETLIELNTNVFVEALDKVKFAASGDDNRPVLRGVHFTISNGTLALAATDSFRLAKNRVDVPADVADATVTVHATGINATAKLLTGATTKVGIGDGGQYVYFTDGLISVATTAIAAEYPKVDNLIPSSYNTHIRVNVSSLVEALRFVQAVGEKGSAVIVSADSESVTVTPQTKSHAASRVNALPVDGNVVEGADITFGMNPAFLSQALAALGTEEVTVMLVDAVKPLRIAGDDDHNVQIVMPVRINV